MNEFEPIRFGKYLLLDKIAVGTTAELYRAKIVGEKGFERLVALKKLLPHITSDEYLVRAFIDEAKLAAFLYHQNIVQIYDFGHLGDSYFIAMEYLFGKDLRKIFHKSDETKFPLSLENALYITSRICDALDYSHNLKDIQGKPLNIIHRDISPHNIFITYEGQVKILDFGIAKAAMQSTLTQVGVIKGKVAYMSPEQAEGNVIDRRSDIFSTGIILYEMVTNKKMFEGDTLKVLSKVRECDFVPPEEIVDDLPPKIYDIIHRALTKDPAERYQSIGNMLSDLEQCMAQLSYGRADRGLAHYMNYLFGAEISTEKLEASRAAENYYLEGEIDFVELEEEKDYVKTLVLPQDLRARRWKKKTMLPYGLGAAVVVLALFVLFWFSIDRVEFFAETKPTDKAGPTSVPKASGHGIKAGAGMEAEIYAMDPYSPGSFVDGLQETSGGQTVVRYAVPAKYEFEEVEKALEALEEERYEKAVLMLEEILKQKPFMEEKLSDDYKWALQGLASQVAGSNPERAEKLLRKSLEVDPNDIRCLSELASLYIMHKDFDDAINTYMKMMGMGFELPEVYFNLGYAYAKKGEYEKARDSYSRAVAMEPSFLDEALFNLAVVQDSLGQKEECRRNLEKALKLNPGNTRAKAYLEVMGSGSGKGS